MASSSPVTPGSTSAVPPRSGLTVKVTWAHAASPLLPESGANITLSADGTALTPKQSPGVRSFSVPAGTSQVVLTATFSAPFQALSGKTVEEKQPMTTAARTAQVLSATQTYNVTTSGLVAQAESAFAGPHPLVSLEQTTPTNAAITVFTDFVDLSGVWADYCYGWSFLSPSPPEASAVKTVVFGYTGGMPLVWYAVIPNAMATFSSNRVPCLVFFRPSSYAYDRVDFPHSCTHLMRFVLQPKADSDASAAAHEREHYDPAAPYFYIRAGFGNALVRSNRSLIMLHPWPSGLNFGDASGTRLRQLCDAAVRFLRATGQICTSVANVASGVLGLSGFSAGGASLWQALQNNQTKIVYVYSFDCTNTSGAQSSITHWFGQDRLRVLRLINGAYRFDDHAKIQNALDPSKTNPNLTVEPVDVSEYTVRTNSFFDHIVSAAPAWRNDSDVHHQWAICGGQMTGGKTDPYALGSVDTYLCRCLINDTSWGNVT